jgi:hypothetical protein
MDVPVETASWTLVIDGPRDPGVWLKRELGLKGRNHWAHRVGRDGMSMPRQYSGFHYGLHPTDVDHPCLLASPN